MCAEHLEPLENSPLVITWLYPTRNQIRMHRPTASEVGSWHSLSCWISKCKRKVNLRFIAVNLGNFYSLSYEQLQLPTCSIFKSLVLLYWATTIGAWICSRLPLRKFYPLFREKATQMFCHEFTKKLPAFFLPFQKKQKYYVLLPIALQVNLLA